MKGETVFSGADAFKLYDTYGFPLDLTIEMVDEQGMTVDEDGFHALMEEQRVRARKAREALGDLAWAGIDLGLDATPTVFTGYDHSVGEGKILALVNGEEVCSELRAGDKGIVVLDQTPFYAEMGGQVADRGSIRTEVPKLVPGDLQTLFFGTAAIVFTLYFQERGPGRNIDAGADFLTRQAPVVMVGEHLQGIGVVIHRIVGAYALAVHLQGAVAVVGSRLQHLLQGGLVSHILGVDAVHQFDAVHLAKSDWS